MKFSGVFLSYKVNASRTVSSPDFTSLSALLSDRRDYVTLGESSHSLEIRAGADDSTTKASFFLCCSPWLYGFQIRKISLIANVYYLRPQPCFDQLFFLSQATVISGIIELQNYECTFTLYKKTSNRSVRFYFLVFLISLSMKFTSFKFSLRFHQSI